MSGKAIKEFPLFGLRGCKVVHVVGVLFIILGLLSIVYYKQGAERYAEFQKGWGLEGKSAIVVGRFIGLFGGFLALTMGVMMVFR